MVILNLKKELLNNMSNEERDTLYTKLMSILMLMEDRDNNRGAMLELESLIEFIKFGQVK
jgi:hypothetical protein